MPGKGSKIKYVFHIMNQSITVISGGQVGRLITMTDNMKRCFYCTHFILGGGEAQ